MSDRIDVAPMLAAMANVAELLSVALDTVTGYRAKCEAAGFSPTASEAMAEDVHRQIIQLLLTPNSKPRSET